MAALLVLGAPEHAMGETSVTYDWGDPGTCPECAEPWEWVRPGKSQPVCDCWQNCPTHGKGAIQYHPEGKYPGISGWFCASCCCPLFPG